MPQVLTNNTRPYDPPMGFYFSVRFENLRAIAEDFRFQSVSGLTSEIVTETHKEGGQNQFDHILPLKTQYADLVLKRGLWVPVGHRSGESSLTGLQQWCQYTMQSLVIRRSDITITLMNPKGDPVMAWSVKKAWPKKWLIADFNAEENQLVIETIELQYNYFTVI